MTDLVIRLEPRTSGPEARLGPASLNHQSMATHLLFAVTVNWLKLSVARPLTDIVIMVQRAEPIVHNDGIAAVRGLPRKFPTLAA